MVHRAVIMIKIISPMILLALAFTALFFNARPVICTSDYILATHLCSFTDFVPESSYGTNLITLLSNLASNANLSTNNGYYATNISALGGDTSESEQIYGLFLCRGDIPSTECNGCVLTASQNMPPEQCPTDKSAVVWYDKCMVRYSNESFLGRVDESVTDKFYKNLEDVTSDAVSYTNLAGEVLQSLASQLGASTSTMPEDKKYFGTQDHQLKDSFVTVYGMAQCTPDLFPSDCQRCLQIIINEIPTYCSGSKGCRMLNPSCSVRYEGYRFYDSAMAASPPSLSSLPPLRAPPIPISSSNFSTLPTGKQDTNHGSLVLKVALGSLVLLLVILVAVFIFLLCRKDTTNGGAGSRIISMRSIRANQSPKFDDAAAGSRIFRASQSSKFDSGDVTSLESLQYELATLEVATNRFSDANKIGEGGFGAVYKGTLQNGVQIAVKRLSQSSEQGLEEFKNEVVLVAKHQHRNLVKLMGFCLTSKEMLLVYEFVCNKSLDLILFDSNTRERLSWCTRYKIINGVARGLSYLHEDSRLKIVHRDLKASNILLDADMSPKISDFGLARSFSENQDQEHTLRVAGTRGYMAPEYVEYGEISTKSDVYSYGVLVLEIISGKKISNRPVGLAKNLLTYAWKHWNENTISTFVDASIEDAYSIDEVKRCIHVGLLCVQGDTEERPSMIKVISYLNSNVDLPAPQQPTFVSSVKIRSSSGTAELLSDRSLKSSSSTSRRVSQSNLSTSKPSQSFPGLDDFC